MTAQEHITTALGMLDSLDFLNESDKNDIVALLTGEVIFRERISEAREQLLQSRLMNDEANAERDKIVMCLLGAITKLGDDPTLKPENGNGRANHAQMLSPPSSPPAADIDITAQLQALEKRINVLEAENAMLKRCGIKTDEVALLLDALTEHGLRSGEWETILFEIDEKLFLYREG